LADSGTFLEKDYTSSWQGLYLFLVRTISSPGKDYTSSWQGLYLLLQGLYLFLVRTISSPGKEYTSSWQGLYILLTMTIPSPGKGNDFAVSNSLLKVIEFGVNETE